MALGVGGQFLVPLFTCAHTVGTVLYALAAVVYVEGPWLKTLLCRQFGVLTVKWASLLPCVLLVSVVLQCCVASSCEWST